MDYLSELFQWESAKAFFNSAFTTSLIGALAGAYAGAMAAQKISERSKERDQLLSQIRGTNAAIMVAFGICNSGLALKKQHVKPLHDAFTKKKSELLDFQRKREIGEITRDTPFNFEADLRSLQMPLVPIDLLRTQVFEKLSVSGRPLALVSTLAGVLSSLSETIRNRNILIERFRRIPADGRGDIPALYFGFPLREGNTSTEYPDTVEALHNQTDDVIFFSELLCKDLEEHGNKILSAYKSRFKDSQETVHTFDFTDARNDGLMPNELNYADWLRGFPLQQKPHS